MIADVVSGLSNHPGFSNIISSMVQELCFVLRKFLNVKNCEIFP